MRANSFWGRFNFHLGHALLLFVIINPVFLLYKFDITNLYKIFVGWLAIFLLLLLVKGLLSGIFIYLYLFIGVSISYFSWMYDVREISAHTFLLLFNHIGEYLSIYAFDAYFYLLVLIFTIYYLYLYRKIKDAALSSYTFFIVAFFMILSSDNKIFPGFVFNKIDYVYDLVTLDIEPVSLNQDQSIFNDLVSSPDYVFLVRLESSRSDLWPDQEVSEIFNKYNFSYIPLKNTFSIRNSTNRSLGYILTKYLDDDDLNAYRYKSFIQYFSDIGYKSFFLNVNDTDIGAPSTNPAALISKEADLVLSRLNSSKNDTIDHDILTGSGERGWDSLPVLNFRKLIKNQLVPKKSLIVISFCCGGHIPWEFYPDNKLFNLHLPKCVPISGDFSSCSKAEVRNSYLNSIEYTKYLLDQILQDIPDSNFFMIGVSDHGQLLGEADAYGHGLLVDGLKLDQSTFSSIFNVASFAAFGGNFEKNNTREVGNLINNAHKKFDHSFVFNSLLDCSSIKANFIDYDTSLCSESFKDQSDRIYHRFINFN